MSVAERAGVGGLAATAVIAGDIVHGAAASGQLGLLVGALAGVAASVLSDMLRAAGRMFVAWAGAKVREFAMRYAVRKALRIAAEQFDRVAAEFHEQRVRGDAPSSLPVPADDTARVDTTRNRRRAE